MRKCENCKHSTKLDSESEDGVSVICRRFPPLRVGPTSTAFPIVSRLWRCGEHSFSIRKLIEPRELRWGIA